MANTKSFIPTTDEGRATWLTYLAQELPSYVGQCTITAADAVNLQKDAAFWAFVVGFQTEMRHASEGFTAFKNELRDGLPSGTFGASSALPELASYPSAPAPPTAGPQGIFQRVRDLAARIKRAPDDTVAIGETLGIEAPATPAKSPAEMQPKLEFRGLNGGHPMLRVGFDGAEQMEIFADRGGATGWVQLTITVRSEFTDMNPLPPPAPRRCGATGPPAAMPTVPSAS